jgi:hypothetical protein
MLEALFLLPIWFYVIFVLAWVVITVTTEFDYPGWGGLALLVAWACLEFLVGIPILRWVGNHPLAVIGLFCAYFVTGTCWAIIKWYFYVAAELRDYYKLRDTYMTDVAKMLPGEVPDVQKPDFLAYLQRVLGHDFREKIQPQAKDHKSRIMTWIGFWPFSALWTLLNDPLRRLVELIYNRIATLIQGISNHLFRGVLKEITPPMKRAEAPEIDATLMRPTAHDPNATVYTSTSDLKRGNG